MSLTTRRVVSRLSSSGLLTVELTVVEIAGPGPGEVLVRIDGAPINPIDIKTLFSGIDPQDLASETVDGAPRIAGQLAGERLGAYRSRLDAEVAVGVEGTGLVVDAGPDGASRAAIGKRVAVAAGGMFSDYRTVALADCLVLPPEAPVEHAAAASINPMTALAMLETMRDGGHSALCLTAAASNLGQMLNRVCLQDGVGLVNIVRSAGQVAMLHDMGAPFVLDSTDPDFDDALEAAMAATGATLAFDATGGGTLGGRILRAMERSLAGSAPLQGRYGSDALKQLYFFGGLDPAPVTFQRDFGMAWSIGGWLLQTVLARIGPARVEAMKERVRGEPGTLFASHYGRRISLAGMMADDAFRAYATPGTGTKTLIAAP